MGNDFNKNANKKSLDGVDSISFTTYRINYSNDEGMKENEGVPLVGGGDYTYFMPYEDYGSFLLLVKGDYTNINSGDEGVFEEVYYIKQASYEGSATVSKLENVGYDVYVDGCGEGCILRLDISLDNKEIWISGWDDSSMTHKNFIKITL